MVCRRPRGDDSLPLETSLSHHDKKRAGPPAAGPLRATPAALLSAACSAPRRGSRTATAMATGNGHGNNHLRRTNSIRLVNGKIHTMDSSTAWSRRC